MGKLDGRSISLEGLYSIIDSDEFYEMLPNDGQDDLILAWLDKRIKQVERDERRKVANGDSAK